jgi:hypothetical protein
LCQVLLPKAAKPGTNMHRGVAAGGKESCIVTNTLLFCYH